MPNGLETLLILRAACPNVQREARSGEQRDRHLAANEKLYKEVSRRDVIYMGKFHSFLPFWLLMHVQSNWGSLHVWKSKNESGLRCTEEPP